MPSIETSSTSSSASTSSDAASAEAAGDSRTCSGMSALLNVRRTSAYSARSDKYRGPTLTSARRPPPARPTTGGWPGPTDLTLYLDAPLRGLAAGLGANAETASRMAAAVQRDPETALRVHTRDELGVDPFELPSPVAAGISSLIAFSAGALTPLLPYLAALTVLGASLAVTAAALLAGGMVVGRLTGRPLLRSGLRQLALGAIAIGVTFAVGSLIGGRGGCTLAGCCLRLAWSVPSRAK